MKKTIALLIAAVLVAGCTQSSNSVDLSSLSDLGELPSINASGMGELESLPPTNISITLGAGIPSSNPFPSEPAIE